jgi:hypothetical protein
MEAEKTQAIRLLDVFVFGPLMIYAGINHAPPKNWLRYALIGMGIGTIWYNGVNYLKNRNQSSQL